MSVLMLCGSPHDKGGNSTYFLEGLSKRLNADETIYNIMKSPKISEIAFLQAIKNGDNIVFSFPLYADSLPAYFLGFLRQLEKSAAGISSQSRVYGIVNCGFYDAVQNHIAVSMLWKWCEKCGFKNGSVLAIGAGGMAQAAPIGKGPLAKAGAALDKMAEDIKNSRSSGSVYIEPAFPRFLYKFAGNMSFTAEAKKNGLQKSEVRKKL